MASDAETVAAAELAELAGPAEPAVTRWAGVPLTVRRSERRARLVEAAFELFGTQGEAGVSVRAVCRAAALHARYFYENFADTGQLLGAVYDKVASDLAGLLPAVLEAAGDDAAERIRAGIRTVLDFSSADPRRGRVLFTEARANPVLIARRQAAQTALMDAVLRQETRTRPAADPRLARVGAAMFTGAMVELAQQWLTGGLGDDLDAVVEHAAALLRTPYAG
ncbi:TetR/AcrR family transcriptional regulator [Planobispora longispora]|uniref:TetR family transcriptional regulator n=1 Tax=Planobispora longispora TaxID=28887 RepID=A0A8J3S0B9_9ACTN|nr:TetR/AcrR family transcriptional regulator [Planobispora longispora]BFE79759.1 TetR/AcrR family transcriptional regulator [Planobispora longispora]GIH81328.1 TetR family transcriptional regulator [Planobispora longispora]